MSLDFLYSFNFSNLSILSLFGLVKYPIYKRVVNNNDGSLFTSKFDVIYVKIESSNESIENFSIIEVYNPLFINIFFTLIFFIKQYILSKLINKYATNIMYTIFVILIDII